MSKTHILKDRLEKAIEKEKQITRHIAITLE